MKNKTLEILNDRAKKLTRTLYSPSNGRVIFESDFDIIAEEVEKLFTPKITG